MMTSPSSLNSSESAFTLPELSVSLAVFSAVCLGLLMGFTALEHNYAAATDFATNHADEMRISDYLALDLRRALKVQASENDTMVYIPAYYDETNNSITPALDGNGGVYYGPAGSTVQIHYYLSGGTVYRKEAAKNPVPLAVNVKNFRFDVTDLGKVVQTRITFSPTFSSQQTSESIVAGTSFYNTTMLRNTRTDIQSGVY
jgi:type II secretory pathway component PulJ